MQPGTFTETQLAWQRRLDRFGGPILRTGLLLIGAATGIAGVGAYESQLLNEWPILALAHGVASYRYLVLPLGLVGALLLGVGLAYRFSNRTYAKQ